MPSVQQSLPYRTVKNARSTKLKPLSPHRSPLKLSSEMNSPRKCHLAVSSSVKAILKTPNQSPCKASSPLKSVRNSPNRSPFKLSSPSKHSLGLSRRCLFASPHMNTPTLSLKDKVALAHSKKRSSSAIRFAEVKNELHHSIPARLVGRAKEKEEIKAFLDEHVHERKAGSLYISGAPGTGKTAVLTTLFEDFKENFNAKTVFVNCMSVKSAVSIYGKIHPSVKTFKGLQSLLQKKGPMLVVCLDEADQLDSKNQEVLYSLFELPALTNSRLILIAVANSLDLTDRLLPRIKMHPLCQPKLMHFSPYSQQQLIDILRDRTQDSPTLQPAALQLCARKVSAVVGDARKAIDACRRTVEIAEASSDPEACSEKQVTAMDMSRVLSAADSQQQLGVGQKTPIQQLLAACAISLQLKKDRTKHTNMCKIHTAYTSICQRQKLDACDFSHFLSLCQMLESRGVVKINSTKNVRTAKVSLEMDEEMLTRNLGNKTLLSSVLKAGL